MRSGRLVFPLFLLICLVTYYPTIGAGFVYDFLGWQKEYDQGSFADIINCFGYKGNHQVLHLFFYSIYWLFHIDGLPWYIIFCTLHAFNAWLLFKWILQITSRWQIQVSHMLVMLVSLFFLIHPYSVEPVVWKVCIHYLLSFSAAIGILLLSPSYVLDDKKKFYWHTCGAYVISLFLLEISFITPLVVSLFLLIQNIVLTGSWRLSKRSIHIIISLWALLAAYILLNKLTLGAWVGHYGSNTHLALDVIGMTSTEVKYAVKHLFYARFYDFHTKALVFDKWLSTPELVFFILTALLSLAVLYFIRGNKMGSRWHLVYFGVLASFLYVLPVSNLFFFHLQIGMNDRYSYLPMAFIWVAVMAAIANLPRWISHLILAVLILYNLKLLEKTNQYWAESTSVMTGLKNSYHWNDHPYVFVLNSPDNLNGIVMASIYGEPSGIDEIIDHQTPKPNTGQMYDIFQYNLTTPNDGVHVEQTGPMQLKVTPNQWGNWWHRNGIGASSYENEFYKAEILDHPYLVTFKQFPPGSVIIYQDGSVWKEFTMKEVKSEE